MRSYSLIPLRAALNMMFICVSITMSATAAFLWTKKQNGKATGSSETSPAEFHTAEREPESLPHQCLLQATQVHHGRRPNLKKLLSERDGSSIGILVSGPPEMRQEVAGICAPGKVENLHFESISSSW
ncbi:hypothetical protein SLE2022_372950 [Rubroshorea leprosula]